MCPLGVIELEDPGDGLEDVVGDAPGVAPLELRVVLDADAGQEGDLLAAESGDPSPAAGG